MDTGKNLTQICPQIITLALFVILQVPTALVNNLGGFLVLRFLAGFIGSPVLATGGASLADMVCILRLCNAVQPLIFTSSKSMVQNPDLWPLESGVLQQSMDQP